MALDFESNLYRPPVTDHESFRDRVDWLNQNIEAYVDHVREYVQDDPIATALLDILIEEKGGVPRKDGVTPFIRHQLDQAMYTIGILRSYDLAEQQAPFINPQAVLRLNIGHDHLEDMFANPRDLIARIRNKTGAQAGDELDYDIWRTVYEIHLMSKHYKGRKAHKLPNNVFHARLTTNPNVSIARMMDSIHNSCTKTDIAGKDITEQAEDSDRTSRMILHKTFGVTAGQLKGVDTDQCLSFTDMARINFPQQQPIYDLLAEELQQIIRMERAYHDLHPDAKRAKNATGALIYNPKFHKSVPGFSNMLPGIVNPTEVLYESIKAQYPKFCVDEIEVRPIEVLAFSPV